MPNDGSLSGHCLVLTTLNGRPIALIKLLHSHSASLVVNTLRTLNIQYSISAAASAAMAIAPPSSNQFGNGISIFYNLTNAIVHFMPKLTLFTSKPIRFSNSRRTCTHPVEPILSNLGRLNTGVRCRKRIKQLPFAVAPPARLPATRTQIDVSSSNSSRFVSNLLLVNSGLPNKLELARAKRGAPDLPRVHVAITSIANTYNTVRTSRSTHA